MRTVEYRELPLTLELAKQHLRLGDSTHDDELITAKLEMAVAVAEDMTGRIIREKVVVFELSTPVDDTILLRLPVHTAEVMELSAAQQLIPEDKYTLLNSDYEDILFVDSELLLSGKTFLTTKIGLITFLHYYLTLLIAINQPE